MATEVKDPAELKREQEEKAVAAEVEAANKARTGVGLRMFYGRTRGKGSMLIKWEAFDESKPDTLPADIQKFMDVTGKSDQKELLNFLITGFNDSQYTAASDPIAEYVEPTWSDDVQTNFRLVVRNYARGTNSELSKAVELIKPGFIAQYGPK